jgi:hypothetical protein
MSSKIFEGSTSEHYLACVIEAAAARIITSPRRMASPGGTIAPGGERLAHHRAVRPGVILLPRLTLSPGDKKPAPATLLVRGPAELKACATGVELRLDEHEAKLVRIASRDKPNVVVLGADGRSATTSLKLPSSVVHHLNYQLEAASFAGDPITIPEKDFVSRPKAKPTPGKPLYPASLPRLAGGGFPAAGDPLYPERQRNEVWVELLHLPAESARPAGNVALFTIAPFLLIPNTQPVEKLLVVYNEVAHSFAYEIAEVCHQRSRWRTAGLPSMKTLRE